MLKTLLEGLDVLAGADIGLLIPGLLFLVAIAFGILHASKTIVYKVKTTNQEPFISSNKGNVLLQIGAGVLLSFFHYFWIYTGLFMLAVGPMGWILMVALGISFITFFIFLNTYKRFKIFAVTYCIGSFLYFCYLVYIMIPNLTYV